MRNTGFGMCDIRIGIVGAGASGLAMAHFLAEAGYDNVVLFERRERIGGKCESITIDGQVYELGAVFGAPHYKVIGGLAGRVGLEHGRCVPGHYYSPDGQRTAMFPRQKFPALLWQLFAKLAALSAYKYHAVYEPGLAEIHPELYENFETFASRYGLAEVPVFFQQITTGFGYGYAEQVPAAYMMKYLSRPMILDCARGKGYIWPAGIQTLWERLSGEHEVLLGAEAQRVTRGDKVLVATTRGQFELDVLILACPLDEALDFLDAAPEERELFSRIRTYDYWVLLCEITGLPRDIGYIRANFAACNQGHLMIWYCRCLGARYYTLYVLGDGRTSQDVIEANCASDLGRLGARLEKVVEARRWSYFPHVETADMAGGFYERLEALQGQRHTYYCGEIMSFSTLECCAYYAQDLVDRFFKENSKSANQRISISAAQLFSS
ncbi:MAG: FAD-dependent oxidoreductase [Candidatus Promineifilaceae bacterium]|jgi:hypothetical protein